MKIPKSTAPVNISKHIWFYRIKNGLDFTVETPNGSTLFRVSKTKNGGLRVFSQPKLQEIYDEIQRRR